MILILQICNIHFHYLEFVKPIEDILRRNGIEFELIHYKKLTDEIISKAHKIIISGTSLKDNEFLNDIDKYAVDTGIEDFSINHEHYLYGGPKRQ